MTMQSGALSSHCCAFSTIRACIPQTVIPNKMLFPQVASCQAFSHSVVKSNKFSREWANSFYMPAETWTASSMHPFLLPRLEGGFQSQQAQASNLLTLQLLTWSGQGNCLLPPASALLCGFFATGYNPPPTQAARSFFPLQMLYLSFQRP